MKLFILLLLVTFSSLHAAPGLSADPFLSNYYRPGYWWPVKFSAPTSRTNEHSLTTSIDEFTMEIPLANQSLANGVVSYFQIYSQRVNLSAKISDSQLKLQKNLSLKAISKNDYLIGIYGTKNLSQYLSGVRKLNNKKLYFVEPAWLPDSWEGLANLNALILAKSRISDRHIKIISKWIKAGGCLIICDTALTKKRNIQELLTLSQQREISFTTEETSWSEFFYGSGRIIVVDKKVSFDFWQPFLKSILPSTKTQLFKMQNVSDLYNLFIPKFWHTSITKTVLSLGIFHGILALLLWFYFARRKNNNKLFYISIAIETIVLWGAMFFYLTYFKAISQTNLIVNKILPEKSVVVGENYYYFFSLKKQSWSHSFSSLPILLTDNKVKLLRTQKGWRVIVDEFPQMAFMIFKTIECYDILGAIESSSSDSLVNHTEMSFTDCLYMDKKGIVVIGNFPLASQIMLDKPRLPYFVTTKLPENWKKPGGFFNWLRYHLPTNIFVAQKKTSSFSSKSAHYQEINIWWMPLKANW